MKKILSALLFGLVIGSVNIAYADDSASVSLDSVKQNIKANLPDLQIDQIIASPVAGVYEVDSGRKVFYVNGNGNYAFVGNLMDLVNKTNLTEQRTDALNKIDWNQLPLGLAIKRVHGTGSNRIAIFTDPDCPFCKRLETDTIPNLKNVTMYYFLYPLAIHANANSDSRKILCAENPESAMISFMAKGVTLGKNATCLNGNKIDQMLSIGNNVVQVNGTPTIILPNGRIISGLVPADYLSRLIDQNQPESGSIVNTSK